MKRFEQVTEEFQRSYIDGLLAQLTDDQRNFFHRLYPNGILKKDLHNAAGLCERTIIKNKEENGN